MHAYVYKSRRKADTYVYLREREGYGVIPEALRAGLGGLEFVLAVELTPERRLAREEAAVVRANLEARGFHLQVPPVAVGAVAVERLGDMASLMPLRVVPCEDAQVDSHGDI